MITRKEYLDLNAELESTELRRNLHRKYWAQFVNSSIIEAVEFTFGRDTLVVGFIQCEYLNSIPLSDWDALIETHKELIDHSLLKQAGDGWSLVSGTCIFKEAARQLIFGDINLAFANQAEFDWSHVRDSTPIGFDRAANYLRSIL